VDHLLAIIAMVVLTVSVTFGVCVYITMKDGE